MENRKKLSLSASVLGKGLAGSFLRSPRSPLFHKFVERFSWRDEAEGPTLRMSSAARSLPAMALGGFSRRDSAPKTREKLLCATIQVEHRVPPYLPCLASRATWDMSADQMTYFTLEIFTEARVLGKDSTAIREVNSTPPHPSVIKLYDNYRRSTPWTQFTDALKSLFAVLEL